MPFVSIFGLFTGIRQNSTQFDTQKGTNCTPNPNNNQKACNFSLPACCRILSKAKTGADRRSGCCRYCSPNKKSHPFWMVSGRSGAALPKLLFRNWSAWSCSSGAPGACDENCPAKGGFYFGRALGRREGSVIYIKVDLPWPVTDPMDLNFSVTCLGLFFRWTIHYDLQDCPFRLIKSSSFDRAV